MGRCVKSSQGINEREEEPREPALLGQRVLCIDSMKRPRFDPQLQSGAREAEVGSYGLMEKDVTKKVTQRTWTETTSQLAVLSGPKN